jgi:thiamine-phosphate pyrophosphorylase
VARDPNDLIRIMPAEGVRTLDPRLLGLYVVTSAGRDHDHADIAAAAIEGGAMAIQLRAPELTVETLAPIARDLADRCRRAGVLFIVNDHSEVAASVGAGGVHLGRSDGSLERARAIVGPGQVLGSSVATIEEARLAAAAGADYLGITVWETPTKPDARGIGIDGLAAVAAATTLPVVGIGGIGAAEAPDVLQAGADGIAVVSAVAAAPDPVAATRVLRRIVDRHTHALDEDAMQGRSSRRDREH